MGKPTAVRTAQGEYMCSSRLKIVRRSKSMSKPGAGVFVCDECDCQENLTAQRAYVSEDTNVKMTSAEAAAFTVAVLLVEQPLPPELGEQICAAVGIDSEKPSCTNESARTE